MLANKDNSHPGSFFTQTGGGPDENTEGGGYVYYSTNLDGNLKPFYKSYPPITRNLHNKCGGGRKRRTKHRRRKNHKRKLTKRRRRVTRHRNKKHRTNKRRTRKHRRRQRGGSDASLTKIIDNSLLENQSTGVNRSAFTPNMNSGKGGRMSSVGGFVPTNECFDNYNHYEHSKITSR